MTLLGRYLTKSPSLPSSNSAITHANHHEKKFLDQRRGVVLPKREIGGLQPDAVCKIPSHRQMLIWRAIFNFFFHNRSVKIDSIHASHRKNSIRATVAIDIPSDNEKAIIILAGTFILLKGLTKYL